MKHLTLCSLLALTLLAGAHQAPVEKFQGKPMPSFKLVDTTGKTHTNASLKGKVVLIDFWATWCGPCKAAMPMVQSLHTKYKAKGLVVIGADILESKNKEGAAAAFKKTTPYTYTFTKNTKESEVLANKLQIEGIPTMLLIDKKGTIQLVKVGFSPSEKGELAAKIEQLLKG